MTVSKRDEASEIGRTTPADEFRRAVAGDSASFAAFLARFERRLARTIQALVPRNDAEDLFQEVCLRLMEKGHLYDPARPLTPWIDAVTHQVCTAYWRRRQRTDRAAPALPPGLVARIADPATAPFSDEHVWVREAIEAVLASMDERQRAAIRLVFSSGLTQRETARRLNVPAGTVATWIARGLRKLRHRLGDRE